MNHKDVYCLDNLRDNVVLDSTSGNYLNGIDYIEVELDTFERSFIKIYFFNTITTQQNDLKPYLEQISNYTITGGVRIRNIKILEITFPSTSDKLVVLTVNSAGDYSNYLLEITADPTKLDYRFSKKYFNFKAECASSFDCKKRIICEADEEKETPIIDYMAKDYNSFRKVLIDYIYQKIPNWNENSEADLGIALIDLMSYVGDHLSYYQDAVSNEMYLETARKRISVRRHAKLIDYYIHDGNSARTFIHINSNNNNNIAPGNGLKIFSRVQTPLYGTNIITNNTEYISPPHNSAINSIFEEEALNATDTVFETITDTKLRHDLNKINIYTWGNEQCALPKGATSAYLDLDNIYDIDKKKLDKGDFLLFEEVKGSETGKEADADINKRQVVRLTEVISAKDYLLGSDINNPIPLTYVAWDTVDALKFPLCLSILKKDNSSDEVIEPNISVARGNLVIAEHGHTIDEEIHENMDNIYSTKIDPRIQLRKYPLSYSVPLPEEDVPVQELMNIKLSDTVPQIKTLKVTPFQLSEEWILMRDLLDCGPFGAFYVVETDNDGQGIIRFGNNEYGLRPKQDSSFEVTYKIGVGVEGNVGVDSLVHVIYENSDINFVRNPVPAWGGIDPEPLDKVRLIAPKAFHAEQFRAITESDYAEKMQKHPEVSKAVATFRWTGSWYTVFITIDPIAGIHINDEKDFLNFKNKLINHISKYKLAGYDVEIQKPIYVPLELQIIICVDTDYFCEHVKEKVLEVLSNKILPSGKIGLFHPDELTFNQPVYLSKIYETIEEVEGVSSVEVEIFKKYGEIEQNELEQGFIAVRQYEIARLDNDPNYPENGKLELIMRGGR
jgi:hypothetical protein